MKKTIITESIDGYNIVFGFDIPVIDPRQTKQIVTPLLEATPEYIAYAQAKDAAAIAIEAAKVAVNNKKAVLMANYIAEDVDVLLRQTQEYSAYQTLQNENPDDTAALSAAYNALQARKIILTRAADSAVNPTLLGTSEYQDYLTTKTEQSGLVKTAEIAMLDQNRTLTVANAEYFQPRSGEIIVDEAQADSLKAAKDALQQYKVLSVTIDENGDIVSSAEIDDYKGLRYWLTDVDGVWSSGIIEAIGESLPSGGILGTDLTAEQIDEIKTQAEEQRIDVLSDADRRTEFEPKAQALAVQAAQQKDVLIITGTSEADATTAATAWLDIELRTLWDEYGYTRIGRQYCIDWAGADIWNQYGIEDI